MLHSTRPCRVLAAMLSLSIALVEQRALAQPAATPTDVPAAEADNPAIGLSRAHFKSGLDAYEREDYATAIEQWEQAHTLMGSVPELIGPRHVMQLDLAQAHLRAYDRDDQRAHLDSARGLLESYVAWLDRPGHDLSPSEREDRPRALGMLARIDIETSRPTARPPAPRVDAPPRSVAPPPAPRVSKRAATGMIAGGSVSLGVAVAGVVGTVVSLRAASRAEHDYERAQAEALDQGFDEPSGPDAAAAQRRGIAANRGAIASMTFIALGTVVGVPLLTAGLVARKRNLRATPTAGRGYAGAQLGFAF